MEVLILGSGTCIPHKRRTAPGLLLKYKKFLVLIDPGAGSIYKLSKCGINYQEIKEVWITHPHPDHHADLVPLLFARRNAFEKLPELVIRSGEPFEDFLKKLEEIYGDWLCSELAPYRFEPLKVSGGELKIGGLCLTWRPVEHGDWALGFRVESKGKKIAYSGDSDFCDSLVELAKDADLLIAECSFPDDSKKPGHLTPKEIGRLAKISRTKKLLVVHLYPESDPVSKVLRVIRKNYDGCAQIAKEGKLYAI